MSASLVRTNSAPPRDGRRRHADVADLVDRQQLELRPGLHHPHLALLGREVQPPVGRHRRRRVARAAEPLLVDLLARRRLVAGQHAGVRAGVEVLPVEDRRRHVRPAAQLAPGDVSVALARPSFSEMSPVAPGLMAKIGWIGRLPLVTNTRSPASDRRRHRHLRLLGQPPQFLARSPGRSRGRTARVGHDLGRASRSARPSANSTTGSRRAAWTRPASRLSRLYAAMNESRLRSHWRMTRSVVDDRRAAEAPLVLLVDGEAGIERAEVALPEQLAVEVVAVQPLGAEAGDDALAVGRRACSSPGCPSGAA